MVIFPVPECILGIDILRNWQNSHIGHTISRPRDCFGSIYTQPGFPPVCCLPVCSPLTSTSDHWPVPTPPHLGGPGRGLTLGNFSRDFSASHHSLPLLLTFKHSIPGAPLVSCSWSLLSSCPRLRSPSLSLCRCHFLKKASLGSKGHASHHGGCSSPA